MTRLLTIMGSGETAPTMVKPHRTIFERLAGDDPRADVSAVLLDTPFGFQENADELSAKTIEYFRVSLKRPMAIAGLKRVDDASVLDRETGFEAIRRAQLVFAGPGSPTYALRQWRGTSLPDLLADKLRSGGAVTFSSAAALTLGLRTVPVYEIYKSGTDPHWLDGLDLLSVLDLPVAVIPHYNNAEGGHHDTRFCYLGERRLRTLEAQLPAGAFILGIDEHTGVVFDLEADTATVVGLGVLTIRRNGVSEEIPVGETVSIDVLRKGSSAGSITRRVPTTTETVVSEERVDSASLGDDAARLGRAFDDAVERRDPAAAVSAVLELDATISAWSADTLQSDEMDRARSLFRSMIVRLGDIAAQGIADPRSVLEPVVRVALATRLEVRAAKRYDLSDLIRDGLAEAGIEVRDTPTGQEWQLRSAT